MTEIKIQDYQGQGFEFGFLRATVEEMHSPQEGTWRKWEEISRLHWQREGGGTEWVGKRDGGVRGRKTITEWSGWVTKLCESRLETCNTRLCSLRIKTSGWLGLRAFSFFLSFFLFHMEREVKWEKSRREEWRPAMGMWWEGEGGKNREEQREREK